MAFFKKLAFWRTEPESILSEPPELPQPDLEQKPLPSRFSPLSSQGLEPPSPASAFAQPISAPQSQNYDAELRVISAKLDTIKAVLDVIIQRLDKLEGKKEELTRWR